MEVAHLECSCRNAAELEIQELGWAQEVAVGLLHTSSCSSHLHTGRTGGILGWAEGREGRKQNLGLGFWARGSWNSSYTRGCHCVPFLSAVHTSFRKMSLWNKTPFLHLFSTPRLVRGCLGPFLPWEGSLSDYCLFIAISDSVLQPLALFKCYSRVRY